MTDEKYIQNQKDFIKKERRFILRDFWQIAVPLSILLVFATVFAVFAISQMPPQDWQEITITLESHEVHHSGRHSVLVLYAKNGKRYKISQKLSQLDNLLVDGKQYTFIYSGARSSRLVRELKIDGVEYINLEESIAKYNRDQTGFWIFAGGFIVLWLAGIFITYKISTSLRKDKIKKYKRRIKEREKKQQ